MKSSAVPVIKLNFNADWKVLSLVLKSDPNIKVHEFMSSQDTATFLSNVKSSLILASLAKKEDLIQIATLMKIYKKIAPDTAVKFVVIKFFGDKNYERAIAKLGIQDVIDPAINTKALRFKIDFWMRGINVQSKQNEAQSANKVKALDQKAAEKNGGDPNAPNWVAPLDLEDDIWLIKNEGDCKRAMGKWVVRIMGPSPYVAHWTEVRGRKNFWKFEFKGAARELYCGGNGNWYYAGEQKPDFIWKENIWFMRGKQYDLYYQDSSTITSRISVKDKVLTISKNSAWAKAKEALVIESFNKEMIFKRDASLATHEEVDTEGGTEKFKNLEGRGKTDKQTSGPLSGETDGTDDLTSGLMAMDINPEDNKLGGHMEGPSSGPVTEGAELSLENKNNEHKTKYKGHNEAEKYDSDWDPTSPAQGNPKSGLMRSPTHGKYRAGDELGLENKNHEDKSKKHRHNETESFEEGELGKHAYEDDQEAFNDYSESPTDKLSNNNGNGYRPESASDKDDMPEVKSDKRGSLAVQKERAEDLFSHEREDRQRSDDDNVSPIEHEHDKEQQNEDHGNTKSRSNRETTDLEEDEELGKEEGDNPEELGSTEYGGSSGKKRKNAARASNTDGSSIQNVHSLADAKNAKERERFLEEEKDTELEEATESAQVMAFLIQNGARISAKLDDFFDQSIIFSSRDNRTTVAEAGLDLSFYYLRKNAKLELRGAVTAIDPDGDGNFYITVEIQPESLSSFGVFMKLYQLRQKKIDFFLKKVKGND
jgi:hypothetical protein